MAQICVCMCVVCGLGFVMYQGGFAAMAWHGAGWERGRRPTCSSQDKQGLLTKTENRRNTTKAQKKHEGLDDYKWVGEGGRTYIIYIIHQTMKKQGTELRTGLKY